MLSVRIQVTGHIRNFLLSAIGQQDHSHERPFRCAGSKFHGCALAVELRAFKLAVTFALQMRVRPSILHALR